MKKEDRLNIKLTIFMIHQRKGKLRPIIINNLKESDEETVIDYLKSHKKYLNHLWDI